MLSYAKLLGCLHTCMHIYIHAYICIARSYCTVEPLLKDTPNKRHNTFNLSVKDRFYGPCRTMTIQFYLDNLCVTVKLQLVPKCPLFKGFTVYGSSTLN